jgi:hypothetical protein
MSDALSMDAITPNQDLIICAHPHCKNLFIAAGGSLSQLEVLAYTGQICHRNAGRHVRRRIGEEVVLGP